MMETGNSNRQYRDRLFKFIFGNPENKKWLLDLYNAINGTNYENVDDIRFNTIENAVYMNMKNDVSFIIDSTMSLFEHQSSYNPNMPLRFLFYLTKLYEAHSQRDDFNIYSSRLQTIPRPNLVCLYNGDQKTGNIEILRLSDMFANTSYEKINEQVDVEVKVVMININYGHNKKLLNSCKPLYEYSFFVGRVKYHVARLKNGTENFTLEDAIDCALNDLPKDFVILPFLLKNKAEVKGMCLFEYDQEKHMKAERAESFDEGKQEGIQEGIKEGIQKGREEGIQKGEEKERIRLLTKLVNDGILTIKKAAKEAGVTEAEFKKLMVSKKD